MDLPVLIISTLLKIVFILAVAVGAFAPMLVWAERRQSAMIQDRVGPHRAGLKVFGKNITLLGLLHPLADALKMIWKEDFVPPKADKFLHAIAPMIALIPAIASFTVIPFADVLYLEYAGEVIPRDGFIEATAIPMQVATLDVGILFIFAIAGTGIIGAAVAGYASDNKFSLLGGLRAAGQMVSYEVVLGLTLVGSFMIYDTLRLEEMVLWQKQNVWGIVTQPVAFVLYAFAAIAETKRIPFDVPEGESEIVGGYLTEYSGMKFGMFFMSEFIEVVVLSALAATIFFGGWDVPFLYRSGFHIGDFHLPIVHGGVIAIQVLAFLLKIVVFMFLQLQVRWTLPRFRYDQIMQLCWKLLLPLSLINILVTGILVLAFG
jgi:NADH-quinone oxidoreductase subunit H